MLGVIYCSPICLVDDFILEHIHLWSENTRYLTIGDFNAPDISWTEMTTEGSINSFDSRFLVKLMEHALVQHVSKPTRFGVNQRSSLLDLVITHETEDIVDLNILPSLVNSDHAVLSFAFRTRDMLYDQVTPRSNVWKANISAIQECAAKTDWFVDTSLSVEEAWSVFKGSWSRNFMDWFMLDTITIGCRPAQWSSRLSVRARDRRPWVRISRAGSWMRTAAKESHDRTKRPSSASRFPKVV
ncbi:hypothetical protein MS3_00006007 [Schistosoma haematobium]|uniref:Endonuclease/exonuclease/phosphatase domain-containing protein n=1 Tax=Schistosoma haematobium TaxID=6185 RepID=A0A922LHQ4_SCHHA|nr:hypothetical protein MS3_00006007 [Schistosoma haematobium]KAH9584376.1 hypothetical protein MS3_00006007 [Schistosoma haematobium]